MNIPSFHGQGDPNCASVDDPDIFFPDPYGLGSGAVSREAKKVCQSCPYIEECLSWAIDNNEPGVWGGTSENERRRMRRSAIKERPSRSTYLSSADLLLSTARERP